MQHPTEGMFPSATAHMRTRGKRLHRWKAALSGLVLAAALQGPASARPGSGYGDLIDRYCIERGRLRVGAHQGHCAACHQTGTFDSTPGHRVEPNWTEFERGRTTGLFDFFCPAPPVPASTAPAPAPGSPSWLPPPGEPAAMGTPPAPAPAAPPPGRPPQAAPPAASAAAVPSSDRLSALHTALRITPAQEPAWREFADAVMAATQRRPSAPAAAAPAARLKARELDLSEHIVALRSVNRALSRLGSQLDETQRRLLSDDFTALLDMI